MSKVSCISSVGTSLRFVLPWCFSVARTTLLHAIMLALIGNHQHAKKNFFFHESDCGSHDPSKCSLCVSV